ncbi:hypothetical protein CI109_101338 [Kwoniella shandongensis]|uniref:cytochrome-b5 reductase n=1 Tax=Kwoniella shandongensis TaxID=1734106 RepID=A0A5M6BU28_9TREE|nr:uncharacterized protein CI109_005283 [Kwoniella shandongensis]KAA5526327.1 hypothetical protein CI109_005283 [Kwoniella shandongensis]
MASAARLFASARLARPSLAAKVPAQARGYATAPASGGANWPLLLSAAGAAGIGAYAYLQYDPSVKKEISAKAHQAEDKAKALVSKGEAKVKDVQAQTDAGVGISALISDAWTPFTLIKVEDYNHNTKRYHFSFGEDGEDKVAGGHPASCLVVKSPDGEDKVVDAKGKPVIRPYTPISPPDQKGSIELLIKEYKDGKITPYMASMKVGQQLMFKGPIQKYKYQPNTFDKGLAIAGGSGITPMYQLITHSLNIPEDKTKWTLLFSNVTEKDILLKDEWDALASQYPDRLEVKYVLDKEPKGWKGETGFITTSTINKVFPRSSEDKVQAFVCGPPPQVASLAGPKDGMKQGELQGALKELGFTSDNVFKF